MASSKASHRAKGARRENVRRLRRESTWPERRLWALLRNRRVSHAKFRRQQLIGQCIVDFYCADAKLVIEVDGESHVGHGRQDEQRDAFLRSQGLRVLRVTNDEVLRSPDAVLEAILRAIDEAVSDG
ncbi:MAG TPA: endonuclease domain-containing protein [Phycisphaerales bacterium]|nr:endonuclease domain-containing protein [Phycisphaerales bacterium]